MSIMIVVHLPECGSHAGHEAPLENRKKCIQYAIMLKLKEKMDCLCACDCDGYGLAELIESEYWGRPGLRGSER